MKAIDITNQRFGRGIAKYYLETNIYGQRVWYFICDCGNSYKASVSQSRSGGKTSCGCLRKESILRVNHSKRGIKVKQECSRGHDTISLESRTQSSHCKKCNTINGILWNKTPRGKTTRMKYNRTSKEQTRSYFRGLRAAIKRDEQLIIDLEARLRILDKGIADAKEE
jgi:hypothetical protein